jgi:hypothetical protein
MVSLYVWLKRIVHSYFFFGCTDRDDRDEHNFHIVSHCETWGLLTISRPPIFFLLNRLYTVAALWPTFPTPPVEATPAKPPAWAQFLAQLPPLAPSLCLPLHAHRVAYLENTRATSHMLVTGVPPPKRLCLPQALNASAPTRTLPLYLAWMEELWRLQGMSPSARYVVRGGGGLPLGPDILLPSCP